MARALFVCLHNAGRSQMSAALFERAAGGRHESASAGTTPGERVYPEVVQVMRELDVDLADRVPRKLTTETAEKADVALVGPQEWARCLVGPVEVMDLEVGDLGLRDVGLLDRLA